MEKQIKFIEILNGIKHFGSITSASKHLYVSQPYVSHVISQLESELNVKLIDRTVKPLKLTFAGEVYLKGLQDLSYQENQLSQIMQEISQSKSGHISISLSAYCDTEQIGQLLAEFFKQYPQYHLEIHEGPSVQAEEMVRDNQCDLYIGPKSNRKSHLVYRIYRKSGFSIITPKSYGTPQKYKSLNQHLTTLIKHPFIALSNKMITGELVKSFFKIQHFTPNTQFVLNDPKLIITTVQNQAGWSIIADNQIPDDLSKINTYPIANDRLQYTLIMAHRSSKENTPEMNALLRISQKIYHINPIQQQIYRE